MKTLLVFAVVLMAFGGIAYAGTRTKCDVVRALRSENVPDSDIRDWLCLVKHESNYRYDAINYNSNGSKDYGIYQLNDRYWCDRGSRIYTSCWQINTYGCGRKCSDFINYYIGWDTACAVKIKKCNSFRKWYGWRAHCQGRNLSSNSAYDFSHC